MNKEILKEVEKRLYSYFEREYTVKGIKLKISKLEEQITQIEEDIKNNNVIIEEESRAVTYGEKVQTSLNYTSYAEREFVKAIERLEREKVFKLARIGELKAELRKVEEEASEIECNMHRLSKLDLEFIELKYKFKPKLSVEEVSNELNMSRSSAYIRRDKIINEIYSWICIPGA
ncbi:sigma-70 family RNA polymerase sigma factor [Clostridium neuense]|uniref:Sigma-70 family RNA polymerase sigma factor n=1 Tax=Clostridium neuense TaxID=1728934 RepID=A0ABW8T8K0_9CLOT